MNVWWGLNNYPHVYMCCEKARREEDVSVKKSRPLIGVTAITQPGEKKCTTLVKQMITKEVSVLH